MHICFQKGSDAKKVLISLEKSGIIILLFYSSKFGSKAKKKGFDKNVYKNRGKLFGQFR